LEGTWPAGAQKERKILIQNQVRRQYIKDQVLNASPERLLLMMYDGAVKNLEDSKSLIEEKDPYEYNQKILNAQNIIAELTGSLKRDQSPELVDNLARLYDYMYRCLVDANLKKEKDKIDIVLKLLRDMRTTWSDAIDKLKEEGVQAVSEQEREKPSLSFQA